MTTKTPDGLPDMGDTPAATDAVPPAAASSSGKVNPLTRIKLASAYDEQNVIKGLFYGPSGDGKTTFLANFPNPLIGVTEHQAIPSIRRANPNASIFSIKTVGDLLDFQAIVGSPKVGTRFQTVGLDSLTDAMRILKDHYTSTQDSGRKDMTDEGTWGVIIEKTARLARVLRDAVGVHTILIALDSELLVNGVGLVHRPSVNGKKLPGDLAQYVNVVGYIHKEELTGGQLRRSILFEAGERYMTKGMEGLRTREPPVPSWIIHKAGLGPVPSQADMDKVTAWEEMAKAAG